MVGPLEADIDFDIIKNDNDTFTVKYTPPGAGLYTIMVLFANQVPPGLSPPGVTRGAFGGGSVPRRAAVSPRHPLCPQEIPSSPFRIKVDPSHDATKVKAEGPGISRTGEGTGGWGCGAGAVGAVGRCGAGCRGAGALGAVDAGGCGSLWGSDCPWVRGRAGSLWVTVGP